MIPELPPLPYEIEPEEAPRGVGKRGPGKAAAALKLALKEAILLAAEEAGDKFAEAAAENGEEVTGGLAGYLRVVAATDPKTFCGLLGKVLPMQITGGEGKPLEVTFRTVYETKDAPAEAP